MELSDEQHRLQESAIAFARQALSCDVIAADAAETFNLDGWRQCAEFGVLGMPIPEQHRRARPRPVGAAGRDGGPRLRHARSGPALLAERAPLDQLDSRSSVRHGRDSAQRTCRALRRQPDRRQRGERARCRLRHLQPCARARSATATRTCSTARRCSSPTRRSRDLFVSLRDHRSGARRDGHHRVHHRARDAGPDDQRASCTRWACARRRWRR